MSFKDWQSVKSQFRMEESEPDEILAMQYDDGYEGFALVVFRRGEKYFAAEGSHCSCHGLEGQWNPTEYPDAKTALECLRRENPYSCRDAHAKAIRKLEARL